MFFDKERQKQYEADLKEWKNNGADDKSKPKNPFEQEAKQFLADMKIKDPEENAVKFYANMFFYYSLYDGAADKAKAKCQFEQMLDKIVEEMKQ